MSRFEVGKTYKTRNGMSVRIIATDRKSNYPLVGFMDIEGADAICAWTADGFASAGVCE